MKKYKIILIGSIHIILVIIFIIIFNFEHGGDTSRYIQVANEFASFNFSFSASANCNTAPGYPFFLAILKPLTSHNKYLIAIVQALIFIFTLSYFFRFFFKKDSLKNTTKYFIVLTFALITISPEVIFMNESAHTESLCASLLLLIFGSLASSFKSKRDKFILIITVPLLIVTKFEYIFIYFIVFVFLLKRNEKKVLINCTALLVLLLGLNGLKNLNTFGVYNPTSFGSGTVIYGGNNLNLSGSWHITGNTKGYIPNKYEPIFDSMKKLPADCLCLTQDSLYKNMAIDAWKKDWKNQVKVIPTKLGKLWLLPGSMDFYTGQKEIIKGLQISHLFSDKAWPWYGKYKHGVILFAYWSFLMMGLIGLYLKYKYYNLNATDYNIIITLIFATFIYSLPFYGLGRFHTPLFPLLAIYIYYFIELVYCYFYTKMNSLSIYKFRYFYKESYQLNRR